MPMIDHDRIASDIRTAAEEVFSTMLSTDLRFAESYRDKGPSHPVDAEVLDAVAEIANMILGNVKTALERSLGTMGMSIPTAIFGKNFLAKSFGNETWSVVVFDCEGQRLEVKLFLKPAPGAPAPGPAKACAPVYLRA